MSWIASNLVISAFLVAVVLLVRRPVARQFGAHAAYALWLAPFIRLILPPLEWTSAPAAAADPSGTIAWMQVSTSKVASTSTPLDWLVLLWFAGAALMLGIHLVRHRRFLSRALQLGQPIEREGVDCDLVMTPAVDGPLATGLVHRLILVPEDFDRRFDANEQRLALTHECLHHRRGDLWASAAALLVASLQWFNPLAHLALGAFRRDMESACDASLIARLGRNKASLYAQTILRSATPPAPLSLCALTSTDELKGRLTMLKLNHGTARRLAGLAVAGGLVATGLALSAPAAAVEPKTTRKEVRTVIVEHDGKGEDSANWNGEEIKSKCPGKLIVVEGGPTGTEEKSERQKILLCTKGESNEEMAQALQHALEDMSKNADTSAAGKAELKAKIEAKIKELRSKS